MTRVAGYGVWADRDNGRVQRELDTVQCCHCQAHIWVKPGSATTVYLLPDLTQPSGWREAPGAGCRLCMKPVCLSCEARGTCTPFERRIEQQEARERLVRQTRGDYR